MDLIVLSRPIRDRPWMGYALALLLSLAALWVRLALGDWLPGYPFLTFFIAITLAAFLGGPGPGLAAALLSLLLARYYLIEPTGQLHFAWPSAAIGLLFYFVLAGGVIRLVHAIQVAHFQRLDAEAALRALNERLEQRVIEATEALRIEIDERASAEAQLRHLQKMESIGQLTGGIAHDFNNMLAIIIGSLDLAKRRLDGDDPAKAAACIDNAAAGAQRAALLTQRLLAFARRQPLAPQPVDVNRLVSGMSEMLRRTIGETIHVEAVLAGGLWQAYADPAQLESAIVNLAVNARDAMAKGGKLTIETANSDLDDRYARDHAEVGAGQYVLVSVSDSGEGMPSEVVERAFDPFFTTKEVGRGTGLGLSQVYGFIKQTGGHVKIYSEVGQGTTVKLYLPRNRGPSAAPKPLPSFSGENRPDRAGRVVLVVEDEAQVRRVTVEALSDLGYTVMQAEDPARALEILDAPSRIDLLFTDVVMPGMNGKELADIVRVRRPEVRILFTTGYTRNAVVHNGVLDAAVAFLPKPFTIEQLALKVQAVLAEEM